MDGNKLKEWLELQIGELTGGKSDIMLGLRLAYIEVLKRLNNREFDTIAEAKNNTLDPIDQRYELAKAAMEGVVSGNDLGSIIAAPGMVSGYCIELADEMIKQLNADNKLKRNYGN